MTRSFRTTARAKRQADVAEQWWRKRHPASAALFRAEVERGIETLRELPELGVPYSHPGRRGIRRLLLPKIGYHLYYRLGAREIVLLAVWHTRRGTPALE